MRVEKQTKQMKPNRLITISLLIITINISAQNIDSLIHSNKIKTINQLVDVLNGCSLDDSVKIRGAYIWITDNIRYDLVKMKKNKPQTQSFTYSDQRELEDMEKKYKLNQAEQTVKKKKGVCEDYSNLLAQICEQLNIECKVVTGYAKTKPSEIGMHIKTTNHAWNIVKINNRWRLIDATWGAGYIDDRTDKWKKSFNDFYFFTDPLQLSYSHFPEDSTCLFLNVGFSKQDFSDLPIFYDPFFKQNFSLIQPGKGLIKAHTGEKIIFILKNQNKNHRLAYSLNNDKTSTLIKQDNDIIEFEVSFKEPISTVLTIFSDENAVLSYKIEIK